MVWLQGAERPACALVTPAGRHQSSGEPSLARPGLAAARELYGDALAIMRQRLPRRHPDHVAARINAALADAAILPSAAAPSDTLAECRRGVRAVRAAGGDASLLWAEMERAVEQGLAAARADRDGPGPGSGPVAVWTMRCGVGLADLAASLRAGPDGAARARA